MKLFALCTSVVATVSGNHIVDLAANLPDVPGVPNLPSASFGADLMVEEPPVPGFTNVLPTNVAPTIVSAPPIPGFTNVAPTILPTNVAPTIVSAPPNVKGFTNVVPTTGRWTTPDAGDDPYDR